MVGAFESTFINAPGEAQQRRRKQTREKIELMERGRGSSLLRWNSPEIHLNVRIEFDPGKTRLQAHSENQTPGQNPNSFLLRIAQLNQQTRGALRGESDGGPEKWKHEPVPLRNNQCTGRFAAEPQARHQAEGGDVNDHDDQDILPGQPDAHGCDAHERSGSGEARFTFGQSNGSSWLKPKEDSGGAERDGPEERKQSERAVKRPNRKAWLEFRLFFELRQILHLDESWWIQICFSTSRWWLRRRRNILKPARIG